MPRISLKQRLSTALSALLGRAPEARYEAAYQGYGERSWLPAATQDARFDADSSTRLELVRRSRYWERNNAIVNKMADVFEQYTVGPNGLQLIPSHPTDSDWNTAAAQWWADWCKFPDVSSGLSFATIQSIMARSWFIDGEVFVYKTFSPESGRPRIQLIEGHRIGTPPELRSEEGRSIVDGIQFKTDPISGQPIGKPLRYWYQTNPVANYYAAQFSPGTPANAGAKWDYIEGDRVLHLFEPTRPGMFRGLPYLYPVMNDLHDLDDLQLLEMKAAKSNAEVANVVTNKTGEPTNLLAARRQKWQIASQDAAGNAVTKQAPLFYEMTVGGRTVYISNGEKFEQFRSDRPGVAQQTYWDYLVRKIGAGTGISALLLMPWSMQGTVVRTDLDISNTFFRSRSSTAAAVMREIYLWAMSWAVKFDRRLDGAPADWWHVAVRPPRSITADVGRNSQAVLEELEAGVRTYQDVCAEMGHDYTHVLRQKAKEAALINSLADEYNVTREQIAQLAKQTMSIRETIEPTGKALEEIEPGADDDSDDQPKKKKKTKTAADVDNRIAISIEDARHGRQWTVERDQSGAITGYIKSN